MLKKNKNSWNYYFNYIYLQEIYSMKSWKEIVENQPKIGKLSNFKFHHKNQYKHVLLEADCECGNKTIKTAIEILKANRVNSLISCNCGQKELVKKQGFKNRKYTINNKIYEESEEKSYIIGFIAADGCNLGTQIEISLQKRDVDILNKIKAFLNYTGNIKINENKNKVRLVLRGVDLCKYLEKEGIHKRKSLTYIVPEKYKEDINFWRGVFDGDGCIYNYSYNYGIHLVGTESMLRDFCKFFKIDNKISKIKNTNVFQINITSKKAYPIIKSLYLNSTIYLNRKYEKAIEILNTRK